MGKEDGKGKATPQPKGESMTSEKKIKELEQSQKKEAGR